MSGRFNQMILNLNTIGKLPEGSKLSTCKEYLTIDYSHPMQCIRRWYRGEHRDRTLLYIKSEINSAMYAYKLLIETNTHSDEIKTLKSSLINCIFGLHNLCKTYYDDDNVISNLTLLIDDVEELVGQKKDINLSQV